MKSLATGAIFCLILSGCMGGPQNPSATQPSTRISPQQALPAYWLNQPAAASITARDFDHLWDACAETARDYLFQIDRQDYRQGLLTTKPMVSKQFFEFWRKDSGTLFYDAENSLQSIRRTLRFEVVRKPDGSYIAYPKVLIERFSEIERRVTSVSEFRYVFIPEVSVDAAPGSNPVTETGQPRVYWYAIGRDEEMEKQVAEEVKDRLAR